MPLTRAGFANVPEVPLSGPHLNLERRGPLSDQELARYRPGDLPEPFCCLVVRRNDDGEAVGVAVAHDLDVENETVSMGLCMVPELVGCETEVEAAGLFLSYVFELHRLREVRLDEGAGPRVAQLVRDLTGQGSSRPAAGLRLSFADWRARRHLAEQLCGIPPRPDDDERFVPLEAEPPNGSPGRSP